MLISRATGAGGIVIKAFICSAGDPGLVPSPGAFMANISAACHMT